MKLPLAVMGWAQEGQTEITPFGHACLTSKQDCQAVWEQMNLQFKGCSQLGITISPGFKAMDWMKSPWE